MSLTVWQPPLYERFANSFIILGNRANIPVAPTNHQSGDSLPGAFRPEYAMMEMSRLAVFYQQNSGGS